MRGELRAASEYLPAVPCTRTYVLLEILLTFWFDLSTRTLNTPCHP